MILGAIFGAMMAFGVVLLFLFAYGIGAVLGDLLEERPIAAWAWILGIGAVIGAVSSLP